MKEFPIGVLIEHRRFSLSYTIDLYDWRVGLRWSPYPNLATKFLVAQAGPLFLYIYWDARKEES